MKPRKKRNRGYAAKQARGNQMYGPGCCAHKITSHQVQAAKEKAYKRGHFIGTPLWLQEST